MSDPVSVIRPDVLNELGQTARACPPGDLVEVGVYRGGSAAVLARVAREQGRRLILFDTFEGIPLAGEFDHHKVGDFGDTSLEHVRAAIPDAEFVVGVFPESMRGVKFVPVALAHIDCDQYETIKACCEIFPVFMANGGVMIFDDYDVLWGARKAVNEAFNDRVQISAQGKARVWFYR